MSRWLMLHVGVLTLLAFSSLSNAQTVDPIAFNALEDSNLKILSHDACKATYFSVNVRPSLTIPPLGPDAFPESFIDEKWVPTGAPENLEPKACAPEELERLYIANRKNLKAQAAKLQKWFAKCGDDPRTDLAKSILAGPRALVKSSTMRYEFCDNPNIRKVVFKLPNGDTVRGVLGLKPGWTPRPLIIAKCGMLCNTGDSGMQLLLMHLFDESPFNIFVVGNNTGADFVRDNGLFIPGGYIEGQQIIQVARLLKKSPLAPIISSLHVVGLSLGGHASLYAAYLNGYNSPRSQPLISSTLAACPAVDLRTAIDDTFSLDLKGLTFSALYEKSIARVTESRPDLSGLFSWMKAPITLRTELIADQALLSLQRYPARRQLPPFQKFSVRSREDFWAINHFKNFAHESLASPTLALAAADDAVVSPTRNIKTLDRTSVAGAITPQGDHCVWGEFYGWRTSSALFRGFILSHSPELVEKRQLERLAFSPGLAARARHIHGLHRLTTFAFSAKRDSLKVTYLMDTAQCDSEGVPRCLREVSFLIPFSSLEARPWWAHAPVNQAQAEALTRWANINLRMVGANGYQIDGTMDDGAEIVWLSYGEEY